MRARRPLASVAVAAAVVLAPVAVASAPAAQSAPAAPSSPEARRDARAPWVPGIPISRPGTTQAAPGFWCSTGLPARKGERTFLVTAGHCAKDGEKVYTAWSDGARRAIGTVTGTSRSLDIAAVRTNAPVAARYWNGSSTTPLRGVATVRSGQKVCQVGYRSGRVCNITVVDSRSRDGKVTSVYGQVGDGRTAARHGDSGGLVVDSRDRAVGVVSAVSDDGRWVEWTPAKTALATWGLSPVG